MKILIPFLLFTLLIKCSELNRAKIFKQQLELINKKYDKKRN